MNIIKYMKSFFKFLSEEDCTIVRPIQFYIEKRLRSFRGGSVEHLTQAVIQEMYERHMKRALLTKDFSPVEFGNLDYAYLDSLVIQKTNSYNVFICLRLRLESWKQTMQDKLNETLKRYQELKKEKL